MSLAQVAYLACVAALFLTKGPSFPLWALTGNMVATFAVCLGMDQAWLGRDDATTAQMVVDFATGAVLIAAPGLSRLIAAGYALNLVFYSVNLLFGVSAEVAFAAIMAVGFLQLAAVAIGQDGDHGIRGDSRRAHVGHPVPLQGRNFSLRQVHMAQDGGNGAEDRWQ